MKLLSFFEKYLYIQSNDSRKKMIGGRAANLGEYPWHVLLVELQYNDVDPETPIFNNKCGGTLISDKWVITSHRCVEYAGDLPLTASFQIVLGGYVFPPVYQQIRPLIIWPTDMTGTTHEIVKGLVNIVKPPNGGFLAYDIALIEMDSRVTLSPKVFPACIPGPDYKFQILKTVWTTGWGYTRTDPLPPVEPSRLQELDLYINNRPACETFIKTGCLAGNMLAITSNFLTAI